MRYAVLLVEVRGTDVLGAGRLGVGASSWVMVEGRGSAAVSMRTSLLRGKPYKVTRLGRRRPRGLRWVV